MLKWHWLATSSHWDGCPRCVIFTWLISNVLNWNKWTRYLQKIRSSGGIYFRIKVCITFISENRYGLSWCRVKIKNNSENLPFLYIKSWCSQECQLLSNESSINLQYKSLSSRYLWFVFSRQKITKKRMLRKLFTKIPVTSWRY